MSREIKFRAWRTDAAGSWMDNGEFYVGEDGLVYEHASRTYDTPNKEIEKIKTQPFLMQFTGLKDPNGKEIYEGDVIHETSPAITADISINGEEEELYDFEATESTSIVVWNSEFARWDGIPFILGKDPRFVWSVVGNIYENPELIK